MEHAFILAGVRTPIGAFQGGLASLTSPQLGAVAIRAVLDKTGLDGARIDEVIMGCVLQGGLGQAPARQAAIFGGIPHSVPSLTVNKVCGSGMKAVMLAAQSIKLGESKFVLAGGMESMSIAPYALTKARSGYRMGNGTLTDLMIHDGLWDPYGNCHMGTYGDETATELGYSRDQLDAFSAESIRRVQDAQANGLFAEEIISVEVPQRKGDPLAVTQDEEPSKANPQKLSSLRPAFNKDGVTTAGNASSINDGACALIIATEAEARQLANPPLGRIVGYCTVAHDPSKFTTAPAVAVERLLSQHHLTVADIDLFEINEAFAVVALGTADALSIPHEKLNVNGGAVALGHPIGMTGARLILTALLELRRRKGRYAVASPCIGGGEATAILLESC